MAARRRLNRRRDNLARSDFVNMSRQLPKATERQRIGNQIDAAMIATLAHFVSLDAHKQPDVPQKA